MKLNHYQSKNFGDALNPYIFNHFIPELLDDDLDIAFVGIGSVLGLEEVMNTRRKVIFSSGFAYGTLPEIDDTYDFFCVRGPLTCKVLNLNSKMAITDGASLLQFMKKEEGKKYNYSFMPHWESALKYNWKKICDLVDVNYLDPTDDYLKNISQIQQSEVVIAEAMHAAIVADSLRVPWLPVRAYGGINSFKWMDWTRSLNMDYFPIKITPLYNNTDFTRKIIKDKTIYPFQHKSLRPIIALYEIYQNAFIESKVANQFNELKKKNPFLSKESICIDKGQQLLECLNKIKLKYS